MPTRSVNLTEELDKFILAKVSSGRFENASEVVRARLRALEQDEREAEERLAAIRRAIDAGDNSPDAAPGVFEHPREARPTALTAHGRGSLQRSCRRRACDQIRPGLLRWEHESHVVFFRKIESGVRIVRVLGERQQPERHDFDEAESDEA
jgi:antitoxin ParD1/3/4